MNQFIEIIGARENNLKNISVKIPKYKLVAITGPSGSGKSTFAMDILQRECQRQYAESLGLLADGLNKPSVDKIIGLSPSISISQRALVGNSKSTVGTYTEILTYLRILYAKLGVMRCTACGECIYPQLNTQSLKIKCGQCKETYAPLTMAHFSFNKPEGACETCKGHGVVTDIDLSVVVDASKTVKEGAFILWDEGVFANHYADVLVKCGEHYGFSFDVNKPIEQYDELESLVFYHGVDSTEFKNRYPDTKKPKKVMDGYFKGVYTFMREKAVESQQKEVRNSKITQAFTKVVCPSCEGSRLNRVSRFVTVNDLTLPELMTFDLMQLADFILTLECSLSESERVIAGVVLEDMIKRLDNVRRIGLGYLSINRELRTLSGGESQRLKLANIIDSGLTGVIYILDEPTTGLHPADVDKLLTALKHLRDLGNTVIVIEHDVTFIKACDEVIDFGPNAGVYGGEIVAVGTPNDISESKSSVTGPYLTPQKRVINETHPNTSSIQVKNAYANNLKNVDVTIPLHQLVCFTGPSGSGKSSLVLDVIASFVKHKKAPCDTIVGHEQIEKVIMIDQMPIGRLSRSNVATYTDVFTLIRELFSNLSEAKKKKLKVSDFSFNVKGGRCEHCQGLGVMLLDMQFLDDVEVVCPVCEGARFNKKVLSVKYVGHHISDVLNMTVSEAYELFKSHELLSYKLETLIEVGLSYLLLGQSTTTLSGGECQRLKLSKELGKKVNEHVLYVLDEPTTGLHPRDIARIISILKRLRDNGHSVFVIEHELEVIIASDYLIDLGIGGGNAGGEVVVAETPKEVLAHTTSVTAQFMRQYLNKK